jgi:hypothetical protein
MLRRSPPNTTVTTAYVCRISAGTVRPRLPRFFSQYFRARLLPNLLASLVLCAVYSYVSLYSSGNTDLFIAASVFVAPMVVFSLGAMASKLMLMRRRIKQRRADAIGRAARATSRLTPAARRAVLRMLMERFLLQHDQLVFDERKSANDARRYQSYGHLLGVVSEVRFGPPDGTGSVPVPPSISGDVMRIGSQDLPFAVINGIFLTRIVDDLVEGGDNTSAFKNFKLQFLIMLTTVMMLVYKLMHLRELPAVWREHAQLLVEQRQLAERHALLHASVQPAAGSDSDSGSDSEPSDDAASGGSGVRDADVNTEAELEPPVPLVGIRTPERLGSADSAQELSLEYDAGSDRVAICLVELRSLPTQATDGGSAQTPR